MLGLMRFAAVLLAVTLTACIDSQGRLRVGDGQYLERTPQEIERSREALSQIGSKDDATRTGDKIEGTAVFQGTVLTVEALNDDWWMARIAVGTVIFGVDETLRTVTVATPLTDKYGVTFRVGGRYKIGAWIIEGEAADLPWAGAKFVTWEWLGTYEMEKAGGTLRN